MGVNLKEELIVLDINVIREVFYCYIVVVIVLVVLIWRRFYLVVIIGNWFIFIFLFCIVL